MLASRGDTSVAELFPELFGPPLADGEVELPLDEQGEVDIDRLDDSKVPWRTATPEEDEELERWLSTRMGEVSGADLASNDDGWR